MPRSCPASQRSTTPDFPITPTHPTPPTPLTRKPIFAANWKMNKGASEPEDFVKSFIAKIQGLNLVSEIVIAPPFVSLPKLAETLHSSGQNSQAIQIAAQNCSQFDAGAYTGEVSVMMLKSEA